MADSVQKALASGYTHVRLNYRGSKVDPTPALSGMPLGTSLGSDPCHRSGRVGARDPKIFERVRKVVRDKPELMQHLHGQLPPITTIQMIKRLEPLRPYFFEDPFYPEDISYLKVLRPQTSVPIAIGEKFANRHDYIELVSNQLLDFIRVHIPTIGGLTMAYKLAVLGNWFNVRTAWHAPGDLSPVGHAVNGHLDLASPTSVFRKARLFPAMRCARSSPNTEDPKGYLFLNEAPGHGVDLDERAAAKYPCSMQGGNFGPKRFPNGSIVSN